MSWSDKKVQHLDLWCYTDPHPIQQFLLHCYPIDCMPKLLNIIMQICQGTVGIQLPDMSGNRMVKTCPIAEWFIN